VAPWYDQIIPGCPPDLRIQKSDKNVFGRVVDLKQPDQNFGSCYMFVEPPESLKQLDPSKCLSCPARSAYVAYIPQLIYLTSRCGGSYATQQGEQCVMGDG
jgi:hypothetical protein